MAYWASLECLRRLELDWKEEESQEFERERKTSDYSSTRRHIWRECWAKKCRCGLQSESRILFRGTESPEHTCTHKQMAEFKEEIVGAHSLAEPLFTFEKVEVSRKRAFADFSVQEFVSQTWDSVGVGSEFLSLFLCSLQTSRPRTDSARENTSWRESLVLRPSRLEERTTWSGDFCTNNRLARAYLS